MRHGVGEDIIVVRLPSVAAEWASHLLDFSTTRISVDAQSAVVVGLHDNGARNAMRTVRRDRWPRWQRAYGRPRCMRREEQREHIVDADHALLTLSSRSEPAWKGQKEGLHHPKDGQDAISI